MADYVSMICNEKSLYSNRLIEQSPICISNTSIIYITYSCVSFNLAGYKVKYDNTATVAMHHYIKHVLNFN